MLEQHGRAFAFTSREIGCVDPKIVEPMVIFTIDHVSWNLKPIPVPRAHISKFIDNGDSRASKRSVLKSVVYGSEEEWVTPVYSRLATGEEGHDPEIRSRSDSGRICGSVCRTRDILRI